MMNELSPSVSRVGKIARLPRELRTELNLRLADGEWGERLAAWLNGLPVVQAVLAAEFGGRPVSAQNLSAWRRGGFQDWLRGEEMRACMRLLAEEGLEIAPEVLAEHIATFALVNLGRTLQNHPARNANPAETRTMLAAVRQLTQMRRIAVAEDRTRLERDRWEAEQAREKAAPTPKPAPTIAPEVHRATTWPAPDSLADPRVIQVESSLIKADQACEKMAA